ncbi:ABC transporter permease [Stenotrophomonas sp. GD03993]|jgi:ABC-2 type transport system permease protein|uniref:ABC transporter permease n=1 Tax=unclassified Stenotrophomonas TaxID=196198 RepID=UPI00244B0CC8|nr:MULTISPECIES: ABC transporter permease [unclassified Stenotrophomonas]MDH0186120.1 ABC transporter permease [Stenotrophomonas sp. GD04051]MDH0465347.1 ABC transporter permease [Stenotrophomonas sp. GD03993]MDH0877938.1 ABC transporter permease [Stenotrophomonas sp. GD03877]MDH2157287.1 ABC transporter permease [Stenotrophomonas sp. GD03657]
MNTMTRTGTAPAQASAWRQALRPYRAELVAELRRAWRTPAFAVPSLLFPVLFYLLFGVLLGRGHAPLYLLATYCVFGAMAPALFGFGVQLALDREGGLLTLKRALPMPPAAPLLARLAMAVLFALLVASLLIGVASVLGGVQLHALQVLQLLAVAGLAALPLGAIGLLIGSHVSASAAPAMVNLVYLPLALLSGLWLPLSALPKVFSTMAPLWPTWHLAQLALPVVGLPSVGSMAGHLLVLLLVTVVALLLARRRLRRIG